LLDVAKSWGISVSAVSFQGGYYGFYRPGDDSITLCTPEEKTFFHELSHAAHHRILRERGEKVIMNGQDWKREIVAELSAAVLCRLVGKSDRDTAGNSFQYIESYAARANKDTLKGIAAVIADVDKVLTRIMESAESLTAVAA